MDSCEQQQKWLFESVFFLTHKLLHDLGSDYYSLIREYNYINCVPNTVNCMLDL